MPQNYVFMTDSDSDLPYDIADARGIRVIQMPYAINGKEYMDDNGRTNDPHAFFQKMRDGEPLGGKTRAEDDFADDEEDFLD